MMFDQVPLVLSDIIHSYLSHHDYRNNCLFASVKYETVYYDFKMLSLTRSFYRVEKLTSLQNKALAIKNITEKNVSVLHCEDVSNFSCLGGSKQQLVTIKTHHVISNLSQFVIYHLYQ
jgi:exosortase/archaeosortase